MGDAEFSPDFEETNGPSPNYGLMPAGSIWDTLDLSSLPELTQERIWNIPEIRHMYFAYQEGYRHQSVTAAVEFESGKVFKDSSMTSTCQLERGRVFAQALLAHYYPSSQGFSVSAETYDIMAQNGWAIELDSHRQLGEWHKIDPEQIAGFVVHKRHELINEEGIVYEELMPHTYLCLMADGVATRPKWNAKSPICRGDIMAHSLGIEAGISKGHCILMIGPYMEFYQFDNDDARMPISPWPVSREFIKYKQNWSLDTRVWALDIAHIWWTWLASSSVTYQNGFRADGTITGAPNGN